MAIKCALSTDQLEFVYGLSKQAIQAKLDKGQPFNVDSFMKYLYERIEKVEDKDRSAQFLAFTPAIIEQVVLNNFAQEVDQIEGFDKISILKVKWADPNTAISNVVNALEQTKRDLKIQRIISQEKEGVIEDKPESQSSFDYGTTFRFKSAAILAGTLASYIPGAGKFQSEVADKERRAINKTLAAISNKISLQNSVTEYPKYQGVNIRLKAVNLGDFTNNNNNNYNGLDGITKKNIGTSRSLVKRGIAPKDVAQVNDRVIMLITDEQGQPLRFNHETGDIVPSNDLSGKFAFQEMRVVRKTGTNSYSLRDIYNMEDKTLSSDDIAEIRSKNDKELTKTDALDQTNAEFKEYYILQQAALKQDVMLDFLGMTDGINAKATAKNFTLDELLAEDIITRSTLEKDTRVLTNPEQGFSAGRTIMNVEGQAYELKGVNISQDLVNQITSVLFDSNIPYATKNNFYNQFLTDQKTGPAYTTSTVTFNKGNIHVSTYAKTNYKDLISEFIIKPSGEVVDVEGKTLNKDEQKINLNNALSKATDNFKSRYLNYNQRLFDEPTKFQIYENGKLVDSNYIDFILKQNIEVTQPVSYTGNFNKQMLFQRPAKDSIQGMAKALPIEQRFVQAEENQYLHDIILEPNSANVAQLNPKYKGKHIYTTPGMYNQSEFGDNVIHSNDIAIDLIATIPLPGGKTFRAINEGESKPNYIYEFSKSGNDYNFKKNTLDPMVQNRIKQLTEQGVTVVTETVNLIKDVNLVVLGDRNNSGVVSVDLNESFFQKELNATENYLTNLNNPPVAPVIKVTPQQNKIVIQPKVEGGPNINESNNKNEKGDDGAPDLTLFRDGKLNPDVVTAEEIKRANEFWAGPLGQRFEKDGLTLNRAANLVNSDAYANFVISGTNLAINLSKKGTMVDVYHESFHAFTQLYLTKEQKIELYEEVRNFTDAKGNQPHLTKSYLELEELLAEDFRTYMKDENVKKDSPKRNSIFRQIVNFLKTLFGLRTAALAKDVSATKEFKDAHTKAWNLTINNRLNAKQRKDLYNDLRFQTGGKKQSLKNLTDTQIKKVLLNDYLNYAKAKDKGGSIALKDTLKAYSRKFKVEAIPFNDIIIGEDLNTKAFKMSGKGIDKRTTSDIVDTAYENTTGILKDAYTMAQGAQLDIMSIPTVKELFENLKIGNPKFLNEYKASIDNAMFFELDRGPLFVDKINNEKRKRTALSKRDGDLVTESIDSIISDLLDINYKNLITDKNVTDLGKISEVKGLAVSALLEDNKIAQVYKYAKQRLKKELAKKNKEYLESVGRENQAISKIESFEQLKKSAAATLKTKEGTPNKYVFLESQIDDFNQFNSDFKAGERVKGQEWMGIKILGNYFTHASIKDGNVPAQVIIVSRIEDAQKQYENYIKGGAQEYEGVDIKKDLEAESLTQSQINLLNNVRILQTAVDEFGDPDFGINDVKPSGMIAYHLNNSVFELRRNNYFTEDEDVSEDITAEKEESQSLNPDQDSFKKSLYDLADKEVIYILKSLHQTDSGKVNSLGFRKLADFRKTWNTISKLVGGIQSRQKMYDILKAESKNFPVLDQLVNTKLADPSVITNGYAFDVSNSFWHTFSRPSAKFWQLSVNQKEVLKKGEKNTPGNLDFIVTQSKVDTAKVTSESKARFAIAKNKYMNNVPGMQATLNLQMVAKNFLNEKGGLIEKSKVEFLRTLGFKLDNNTRIYEQLDSRALTSDISNLATLVKDLYDLVNISSEEQTQKARVFVQKFIQNPISFLQNEDLIKENIDLLKSFKNIESLRSDSIVRTLADIQAEYGFDTPGQSITLPDGESAQEIANHSSTASIVLGINDLTDNLDEAYKQDSHLSFLNPNLNNKELPYNPLAARNKVLQTMFPNGKRDASKEMQFSLVAGTEFQMQGKRDTGIVTAELVARDRHFQAYNMMLQRGIGEFIKHSDKRSSFGIVLDKKKNWGNYNTGTNNNLWVDINKFSSAEGHDLAFNVFIVDYIANEFDRIQYFSKKENQAELKRNTGYSRKLSNDRAAGMSFVLTDSLMSDTSKKQLYELAESDEYIDIVDYIQNTKELRDSLIKESKTYFEDKTEYNAKSLQGLLKLNKAFENFEENTLAAAFTYNNFINKVEMSNLLNGDLAQFSAFTKRVPGSTSDGNSFIYDESAMKFIDEVFQGKGVDTYAKSIKQENFKMKGGTLNTGVIMDPIRKSIYLDEMKDAWTKDYILQGFTESQAKALVLKDAEPYEKMEEADGSAYLTFDAYRVLRKLANKWKPEHQALYEDIIAGKPVNAADVKRFFPVYKLHNYGPLMNSGLVTTSMYKFAVAPIIPSVAIEGTELKKLHDKMVESDVQMVTFKTGSKVSNITSKENAKNDADNIFQTRKDIGKINMSEKYVEFDNKKAPIANNKIHLRYLKDVTEVTDELKGKITVPTQPRVVLESRLYERGKILKGMEQHKGLAKDYRSAVSNYTQVLETELLNEIGFTKTKDGKYVSLSDGSLEKLVRTVRAELASKGAPEQLQNIIDVNMSGRLKIDFSIHPEAQVVEQILVMRISKAISGQKTKGEKDVQVPNTFYNGLWNSVEEMEAAMTKNDAKITEFLKDKIGTNNLPFYRRGKNETKLANVAIALNGDFVNLLNLEYIGKDGKSDGTLISDIPEDSKITARKRLNEMLLNETWMDKHRKKVTITGPRIPTDATNLIEAFEVIHFLDPSAGTTAVVPTEIVAKAGSDFDVDALFFSFPNINKDGSLPTEVKNLEQEIAKLRKESKSVKGIINQQKAFAQNDLITQSVNILKLPEVFGALTKPATTRLFEDEVTKQLGKNSKDYGVEGLTSLKGSPTKVFEDEYDNDVFDILMGGSAALGITAKKVKQHTLNKSIGAKMPLAYEKGNLVRKFKLNFPHNKFDAGNISLSDTVNQEGVLISEILSNELQGILDRGNDDTVMRAGIIKQSVSMLNRLIETGVPLSTVIAFINTPVIKRYLNNVAASKGIVAKLNSQDFSKEEIVGKLLNDTVLSDRDAIDYYNEKSINEAFRAMNTVSKDPRLSTNISIGAYKDGFIKENFESYDEFVQFTKLKKLKKNDISSIYLNGQNVYSKLSFDTTYPKLINKSYYLGEYYWKKSFGNSEVNVNKIENVSDAQQAALLFEFLNVEKQFKGMDDFEINFNPDTGLIGTVYSAEARSAYINTLKTNTQVDKELINNFINSSVISSMYKTQIFTDIVKPLFDLRLNNKLQNAIMTKLQEKGDRDKIIERFGDNSETNEKFITAMNNAMVDYIYQNILSSYVDAKGLPTELPKVIRSKKVVRTKLEGNTSVKFTAKTVRVDLDKLKKEFNSPNLSESNPMFQNVDTFPTFNSYIKYSVERAFFEDQYKDSNLSEDRINEKVTKRALATSFNPGYVKGTIGFGPVPNNYTNDILKFVEDPRFKSVVENYPVLSHLSPAFFLQRKGYNLLDLNNKKLIDEDTAKDYYLQLKELGDHEFLKGDDARVSDSISDLFKNFSQIAIYQQGSGKSGLSFIKSLDPEGFVSVLRAPTLNFRLQLFGDTSNVSKKQFQDIEESKQNIVNTLFDSVTSLTHYKQLNVSSKEFFGKVESLELLEIDYSDPSYTSQDLYEAYENALFDEAVDNEAGGLGSATVTAIEKALIDRGLPLKPGQENKGPTDQGSIEVKGKKIINNEDIAAFKKYKEKSSGINPKEFFTSKTVFTEFYNNDTGKREGAPQSSIWMLQLNNRYDLTDKETGEVYITNVDLNTGIQYLSPVQPTDDGPTKSQIGKDGLTPFSRDLKVRIIKANLEKPRSIALGERNSNLILEGKKTTTLRTKEIHDGIYDINGKLFVLTSRSHHPYLGTTLTGRHQWFGEPNKQGALSTRRKAEKIVTNKEYTKEEILNLLESEALPRVPSEENKYKIDFDGDVWFAKYPSTVDFFEKGRGLYVYDIKPFVASEYGYEPILEDVEFDRNDPATYTNHSGGAIGADSMFDKIGKEFGQIMHNHYYYGEKTPLGNVRLTEAQFLEGIEEMNKAAKILGKNPKRKETIAKLARNWFQVKNSDTIIAIAPIDDSLKFVKGGTGWAVAMAQANANTRPRNINVFNTKDNTWYIWNEKPSVMSFVKTAAPTLTKDFAGIGSRQDNGTMTPESIQAIRDVYEKTFGKPTDDGPVSKKAVTTPVNGGSVTTIDNAFTEKESKDYVDKVENLLNTEENRMSNRNDESKQVAISYGPLEYRYSMGPGRTAVHTKKIQPDWMQELSRKVEKDLGKPRGYYNHVLINRYGDDVGIGTHTDAESIYDNEAGEVGSVVIYSIGETKNKHTIGGVDFQAKNNSLAEMSTGKLTHSVGRAKGTRYSINFRHIPSSQLPVGLQIEPALENFYRSLTKEQLNNPKLPSMDRAQVEFENFYDGTIESFIDELKCK